MRTADSCSQLAGAGSTNLLQNTVVIYVIYNSNYKGLELGPLNFSVRSVVRPSYQVEDMSHVQCPGLATNGGSGFVTDGCFRKYGALLRVPYLRNPMIWVEYSVPLILGNSQIQ